MVSVGGAGGASAEVDLEGAACDPRVGQDSKSRESTTALPGCFVKESSALIGVRRQARRLGTVLESFVEPYLT